MVLEALDKIREAEESVEIMRQALKHELTLYEQEKTETLKHKKEKSQKKIMSLLQELEAQNEHQLQKEKDLLLSEAQEQNQDFKEKYDKNKESIIDYVIERVKEIYGSQ